MDESCSYMSKNRDGVVQKSLKLYKLDNTYVKTLQDVKNFRFGASRRGMAKAHILDPRTGMYELMKRHPGSQASG